MHTLGVSLLFAAIVMRGLFWYSKGPYLGWLVAIWALYGLLFYAEPLLERRFAKDRTARLRWVQGAYLVLQSCLVAAMLVIPPLNDFGGTLFIPLSLQAVLFYQRRAGFLWTAAFTLLMAAILLRGGDKFPGGLVMALFYGGTCFLSGGYAHLIRIAEQARRDNQRTLDQLQVAHRQIQGYATQREELAAERERNRLARELHDSVTQTAFSMNLTTQSARMLLDKDLHRVGAQLDRLEELARSAMGEIQLLVTQLGPEPAAGEDLLTAVQRLIAARRAHNGLNIGLEVTSLKDLSASVTAGLSHIIQEALNNVAKHAGTGAATIRLNLVADPAWVEIEDQGVGFDLHEAQSQPGHLGLAGMFERAGELGWDLCVESRPGRGTRIRISERPGQR
ncbi:MAG TPA: sensor histidine kinase [Anaerolineales bacterium]|jgi:signal transduction histidine kinase|nr:sensor histidine kinase [Anaerolineales bacterium]